MLTSSRRSFIIGLVSLMAAPAIVRAGSLMPVKSLLLDAKQVLVADGSFEIFGAYQAMRAAMDRALYGDPLVEWTVLGPVAHSPEIG